MELENMSQIQFHASSDNLISDNYGKDNDNLIEITRYEDSPQKEKKTLYSIKYDNPGKEKFDGKDGKKVKLEKQNKKHCSTLSYSNVSFDSPIESGSDHYIHEIVEDTLIGINEAKVPRINFKKEFQYSDTDISPITKTKQECSWDELAHIEATKSSYKKNVHKKHSQGTDSHKDVENVSCVESTSTENNIEKCNIGLVLLNKIPNSKKSDNTIQGETETPSSRIKHLKSSYKYAKKTFEKQRKQTEVGDMIDADVNTTGNQLQPVQEYILHDHHKIIGIFVHKSDYLMADNLVQHPVVKVHLIDANTGEYLTKSNIDRPATFYNETKDIDVILPLITEMFDFKCRRSFLPCWEELLIFNEDIEHILKRDPLVIIIFEIMDFVTFSVASSQYRKLGAEGGWHKVAWAFLKPLATNEIVNTENEMRLQLYKPQKKIISNRNKCDAYLWWKARQWEQYPASLYVTVKGITPPKHVPAALRSRSALQNEHVGESEEQKHEIMSEDNTTHSGVLPSSGISLPNWSRLPSQSCKVPNKRALYLPTASKGCFTIKFSNSGLFLASATVSYEKYAILVYTIPDGEEYIQFCGHQGLVYDLNFSANDTLLLSASADCTACIWDVENKKSTPLAILPHPSYLYCAQFCNGSSSVLATGCCDHVVRIWKISHQTHQYVLTQELEGHSGFVSSLCFDTVGNIITANSIGEIFLWSAVSKSKKLSKNFTLLRKLTLHEMKGSVINKLQIHPGGRRLLIHSRDNLLRMLDISTASIIQWYKGALNHRIQTSACISPCGGLIFAASEDGTVCVWNADTGEQMAVYAGLEFNKGTTGVDYHPHEHMVAFSSYGAPSRILVCSYDKSTSTKNVGLQLFSEQMESCSDVSRIDSLFDESGKKSAVHLDGSRSEVSLESVRNVNKITNTDGTTFTFTPDLNTLALSKSSLITSKDESGIDCNNVRLTTIIEEMDKVLLNSPPGSCNLKKIKTKQILS